MFWYQDWQYSLPTPRPSSLRQPPLGTRLELPADLPARQKPTFIHFFNAECPCSRFNVDHVRDLIRQFGDRVTFAAVVESDHRRDALSAFNALDLGIPATVDSAVNIASRYGVYSTPQAVILDQDGKLYYRGNYNLSRYCVDPATEFARIALEKILANLPKPPLPAEATVAYGCPLPKRHSGAAQ
jgi:hypothetical protein